MLIQNISNAAQVAAPARPAGNGGPGGVAAEVAQTPAQTPSPAQLQSEVSKINSALQQANKNLELSISVDKSTNKQIVKLTDKDTGDTLLQYPSEAMLAIAQGIDEFQRGLLLKQQA
ncbi:MAG: flagellar protein FlaG [Gammaproteobacteria bacterium]|nr:flagellar protein FlaG [Sideroxydans sp.]MBU3904426.1 flagellar protein FlaG [Gammaproteobacteria bacterium]MBU4046409.1 flagellar protein FlaG [Gammaproteobacteria bacterium]MBU4150870.1 flagellar protein FlaG [Gammaproteobacteria bacterium]